MKSPVRLHLSLEKKTIALLKKRARGQSKTITQTLRELAESYASGRLTLRDSEPPGLILRRIRSLRHRSAEVSARSEEIIRSFRDARA
jgi:hypothetical protein